MSVHAERPELDAIDIASHELYEAGCRTRGSGCSGNGRPVHWHPWDWRHGGFWAVTKHADSWRRRRTRDVHLGRGHQPLGARSAEAIEARRSILESDPPATPGCAASSARRSRRGR